MIVQNDLDRGIGRIGCIELLEKADEFARAVAVFDIGMNLAGEQVDPASRLNVPRRLYSWSRATQACLPATGGRSGAVLEIAWMPGFSS